MINHGRSVLERRIKMPRLLAQNPQLAPCPEGGPSHMPGVPCLSCMETGCWTRSASKGGSCDFE